MEGMLGRIPVYIRFMTALIPGRGIKSWPEPARDFLRIAVRGRDIRDSGYGNLEKIEELRRSLLRNPRVLNVEDHGAGSARSEGERRTVRQLVRTTAVGPGKGLMLARIARYFNFPVILELGTGSGISSLYLGMACPRSRILTCEGSPAVARLAESNFRKTGADNIEISTGLFGDWLPGALRQVPGEVLVFLDGDHREESLLHYCSMVLDAGFSRAVLVLDDIHWSPGMYRAWKQLAGREGLNLSLELFNTGILLSGFDF